MYPQPPEDYSDEEKRAWECLNHPHGEEFPGQYDYERKILSRRESKYDKSPFSNDE